MQGAIAILGTRTRMVYVLETIADVLEILAQAMENVADYCEEMDKKK